MKVPEFYHGPVVKIPELSTQGGAHRMAERIKAVWKKAGHDIEVSVEYLLPGVQVGGKNNVWGVKTNLVNGLPK